MDVALFVSSAWMYRAYLVRRLAGSGSASAARSGGRRVGVGGVGVRPTVAFSASTKYSTANGVPLTLELLAKQNAETSNAIIAYFGNSTKFVKLSDYEGHLTLTRDREDDDKLQKGIEYARSKGVVDPEYVPEPYTAIDVLGKTPLQVAEYILDTVQKEKDKNASSADDDDDDDEGMVLVLVGLSGTGKGTTVSKLRSLLEQQGKRVVTWSNGNIFRSYTLLATTWLSQQQGQQAENKNATLQDALTPERLSEFTSMLSFHKHANGIFDTRIRGLGMDVLVNDVQNTVLKSPQVSKNIPTVAEYTQGEVIAFAANAVDKLRRAGYVVLLEGREQTVNYVRTPHRFTLTLSDPRLIGKRRAAQRVMASAYEQLTQTENNAPPSEQIESVLNDTLTAMVREIH